jgi:Carboxypeptidase regulatory-like domain
MQALDAPQQAERVSGRKPMPLRKILAAGGLTVVALAIGGLLPVYAQSQPALSGQVASAEEGPMEGVLVSAKKRGSTVTVTVVSDDGGNYSFPAAKLEPGQYSLRIRAIGYDLDRPVNMDVIPQQSAKLDLKLRKTEDLASQLLERRMAGELSRHRPAKECDAGLRRLPYARTSRALKPKAR